jgi:hypothetical protein
MGSGSCWSGPARSPLTAARARRRISTLIAPTPANARKVAAALAEFGFAKLAADWTWFTKPYRGGPARSIAWLERVPTDEIARGRKQRDQRDMAL